jgi:hypothetical protein
MLTGFEKRALDLLLDGDDSRLEILRAQLDSATITERIYSDSGFYTNFAVPAASPRLPDSKSFVIDDVSAEVVGFRHPVTFLVFVSDGALDMLECVSVGDDPCPKGATIRRAFYVRPIAPGSFGLAEARERDLGWALGDKGPTAPRVGVKVVRH